MKNLFKGFVVKDWFSNINTKKFQ